MITSAEHFNRAIELWFDLTGMDPNAKSWKWGQLELRSMNEELLESMKYDDTFITTFLLLDAYSTSYFKEARVSVHEFDEDPDKIFDYMDKVREFKNLIRSDEVMHVADEFFEQVRKALLHYGIEAERIAKFLDERANLAYIRRDALKSINRLRADHFLQGDIDPPEVQPVYNRVVFGYWNINSMIEHVCGMPSGVSLNLIRDPDELHSYFSIAVRNGGNMIMLTDVPEYAHPLGRYMSRRPDRDFSARTSKNWFPYQLLSIKYNAKGDPYHDKYRASLAKGLVPHQPKHFELEKLVNLDIAQIVWTTLLFDLIIERYWRNPIPQKALSYTNEMIRLEDQSALIAKAAGANLPVTGYQPLNLPVLTPKDVMTDALDDAAIGARWEGFEGRYGSRRWMEERYGERVPIEALNQIGPHDGSHLFLSHNPDQPHEQRWDKQKSTGVVVREGQVQSIHPGDDHFAQREPFRNLATEDNPIYPLERVDSTMFGTREQIDADRKFIARVNFAKAIQREADAEFLTERPKVLEWFRDAVEDNIDRLIAYATLDEVEHTRARIDTFGRMAKDETGLERYTFSKVWDLNEKRESYYDYPPMGMMKFNSGYEPHPGFHRCYFTEAKSSWQLHIQPGCPADLCLITGTKFEDLPVFLQHWNPGDDPYVGNSILNRIDPLEWKLDSPWDQVSFSVDVFLSKRGRTKVMKEYTPPAIPDVSGVLNKGITRQNGRSRRAHISHSDWRMDEYITGEPKKR